jgi:N-acetylglucosamine-6-phosphate deacetylase
VTVGGLRISGRELATGTSISVVVEDELVVAIDPAPHECDLWISPGLVDLQINGYRGLDLNGRSPSPETVSQLARALLSTGTTTFAPTVMSASEPEILRRLACVARARASDDVARKCIPYIHVEGPHISSLDGYRGAHPRDAVRPPSVQEFERWQAACDGLVGLVTMSPHFMNSVEYIAHLTKCGVHVSIGHTHASHHQIKAAVDAGARLSTHLGNGIPIKLDRHPNPVWSQLAEELLTASFIADGHHLPAETLKAMVQAKGLDRSFLVSDAVTFAGMPAGNYTAPVGAVELTTDGRLHMVGSQLLAGAAFPLSSCIGRAVRMTGRPLNEVVRMATENPGRFAKNRGRLQQGTRADIIRFRWAQGDEAPSIQDVWLAGEAMAIV